MSEGTLEQLLAREAAWSLQHGDCRELMRRLPDNCVDFVGTDAPYHLTQASRKGSPRKNDKATPFGRHAIGEKGFMGRTWDGGGVAFDPETWAEVLRVAKPGAHLMAFGGSRTFHRLACAIEDAGWEIRDSILVFCHGEGFPKGTPQLKGTGLQTALKPSVEPIVLARKPCSEKTVLANVKRWGTGAMNVDACRVAHAGAVDLAAHQAQVEAIKSRGGSMSESWKNTSDLSGASDVNTAGRWPPNLLLQHAPDCKRIGTASVAANPTWDTPSRNTEPSAFTGSEVSKVRHTNSSLVQGQPGTNRRKPEALPVAVEGSLRPATRESGRLATSECDSERRAGTPAVRTLDQGSLSNGREGEASADKRYAGQGSTSFAPLPGARRDDGETVEQWECVDGCPVAELARQTGESKSSNHVRHNEAFVSGSRENPSRAHETVGVSDSGSAARYFPQFGWSDLDHELALVTPFLYTSKPSSSETEAGLDYFRRRSQKHDGEPPDGSGVRNPHPTKKSVELCRWLMRLGCPPKGLAFDPFSGTAPMGIAALLEGLRWLGFELHDDDEEPFVSIGHARLTYLEGRVVVPRQSLRTADPPKQRSLFSIGESASIATRAHQKGDAGV